MDRCVVDDCQRTAIYPLGYDEAYYCGNHHAWILFTVVRDLHQPKYKSDTEYWIDDSYVSGYAQQEALEWPNIHRKMRRFNGVFYIDRPVSQWEARYAAR